MANHDEARATGRTARIVLKTVLEMSKTPGEWIEVTNEYPTNDAKRYTARWIRDVCGVLYMTTEFKNNKNGYFMRFVK